MSDSCLHWELPGVSWSGPLRLPWLLARLTSGVAPLPKNFRTRKTLLLFETVKSVNCPSLTLLHSESEAKNNKQVVAYYVTRTEGVCIIPDQVEEEGSQA